MTNAPQPRNRGWVMALVAAVVVTACSGPAAPAETELVPTAHAPSVAPAAAVPDEPHCIQRDFPCSLAETPTDVIARITDLMAAARERAIAGSMADALSHLQAQPDVVEAWGSDDAIVFRVEGASEAWLVDRPAQNASATAPFADARLASAVVPDDPAARVPMGSVVGEDTNGDLRVDNRDAKRALVLAPYLWEFAPWDESDLLAEQLGRLPSYAGNVTFAANRVDGEQRVTIDHYRSFDAYDAIFLSTHGHRACSKVDQALCKVVISTGLRVNATEVPRERLRGFVPLGTIDDEAAMSNAVIGLGITDYFFHTHYPGGLDDTLLVLSACQTGRAEGMALAAAAGGENFVMVGWSESVAAEDAFRAHRLFADRLALGNSTDQAHAAVVEAGLDRSVDEEGVEAVFELLAPRSDAVRLIELPTLLQDGQPMQDGADVSRLVPGQPGDGAADRLQLSLEVAGVHEPMFYSVRYEVDGLAAVGDYDLLGASPGDLEGTYLVEHDVDIGFDLPPEGFSLEAIVELPEGGESRYHVEVTVGVRCDLLPMPLPAGAEAVLRANTVIAEGDDTCVFTVPSYQAAVDFIRRELPDAGYVLTGEVSPRVPVDERNLRSIGWVITDGPGLCGLTVIGLIEHPDATELDITVLAECE